MIGLILLFLGYLVVLGLLLALSSGVGFLLHWLLPEVELGMALLIGTVMSGLALHVFIQLFRSFQDFNLSESLDEWEEEVAIEIPPRGKRNRRR